MGTAAAALLLFLAQEVDYQAEGLKALEAQKYDAAAELFAKAVGADPADYAAHFHLALATSMLGQDAEAIAGYRRTLELKPGLYQAELNLGILLLRQNDAAGALPHLKSAAEKKPDLARPQLYLGDALYALERYEDAVPAYAAAHEERGLGRALLRLERFTEAEEHLRNAGPDGLLELAAARERAGARLLEQGQAEESIPHLEYAAGRSPTSANRAALARALMQIKQTERALGVLAQALQAEPRDYELRMHVGRLLRDQRKFPEAAAQFLAAAQLKQDKVEAWSELAGASILMENYAQGLAALDRVKSLGAETSAHFYFRAIVLDKLRQYPPALENYEKFLATSNGKSPDEEFKARQRVRIIRKEMSRR